MLQRLISNPDQPRFRNDVYSTLKRLDNVNKIEFLGISYQFNHEDFVYLRTIADKDKIVVEQYLHKPSRHELGIKFFRINQRRSSRDEEVEKEKRDLVSEIENHRKLRHAENVVVFYGFCLYKVHGLICMELMDMSLTGFYSKVYDEEGEFPEKIFGYITVQVVNALKQCKDLKVMHRDIKPDNILVNWKGDVKLCDFGVARLLDTNSLASTIQSGTIVYWPPERFNDNLGEYKYDIRADVWSLGITLAEVAHSCNPYNIGQKPISLSLDNLPEIRIRILSATKTDFVNRCLPENYTNEAKDFVKICLTPRETRPKLDGLLQMTYYRDNLNINKNAILPFFANLKIENNDSFTLQWLDSWTLFFKLNTTSFVIFPRSSAKLDNIHEVDVSINPWSDEPDVMDYLYSKFPNMLWCMSETWNNAGVKEPLPSHIVNIFPYGSKQILNIRNNEFTLTHHVSMFWTIQNKLLNLAFVWWYSDYYKQALANALGPFDFLFVHNVKEERPRISPKEIIELDQMIKPKKKTIVTLAEFNLTKATFISDFMEECQNLNVSSDNFIFLRLDEIVNLLEN